MSAKKVVFGQYLVNASQVFYKSKLCLALVNLKPVVKGHVLVIPKRKVQFFKDLSTDEITDVFYSAQKISNVLQREFKSPALTLAVQDGKDAGQTVEHLHVHLLPRHKGDFPKNDDVYSEIEKEDRPSRTEEDMAQEAEFLAKFFPENEAFSLLLDP